MEAFDTYRTFLAVKLHFTDSVYDYFTYNGQIKANEEAFLASKGKYSFVKLSRTANEKEFPYVIALAMMNYGKHLWVQDFNKTNQFNTEFLDWKNWQENRVENFKKDLTFIQKKYRIDTLEHFAKIFKVEQVQIPEVYVDYDERSIDLSTLLIFDYHFNTFENWNSKLQGIFLWDEFYSRAKKFKAFFYAWKPLSDINIMRALKECIQQEEHRPQDLNVDKDQLSSQPVQKIIQ
jgi:hypothetical protein